MSMPKVRNIAMGLGFEPRPRAISQKYTVIQLHIKVIFFDPFCFPLVFKAIHYLYVFGFVKNPNGLNII